jgi:hypothetical protein
VAKRDGVLDCSNFRDHDNFAGPCHDELDIQGHVFFLDFLQPTEVAGFLLAQFSHLPFEESELVGPQDFNEEVVEPVLHDEWLQDNDCVLTLRIFWEEEVSDLEVLVLVLEVLDLHVQRVREHHVWGAYLGYGKEVD